MEAATATFAAIARAFIPSFAGGAPIVDTSPNMAAQADLDRNKSFLVAPIPFPRSLG